MPRVAIVTGGTRGIGRAICEALRDQGATVVANYAGNEEKARAFTAETGIKAYKWNVGDHEACLEGCGQVADEVGPVDILVNNAGITRDGTLLRMSYDDWTEVLRVNLGGCFNVNAIAPGYIDTEMVAAVPENVLEKIVARIPVGRLGHAEEIARGVAFLCSDDAGFVTGSTLSINGGQHMY